MGGIYFKKRETHTIRQKECKMQRKFLRESWENNRREGGRNRKLDNVGAKEWELTESITERERKRE